MSNKTKQETIDAIYSKYPVYKDRNDDEGVYQAWINKYPVYKAIDHDIPLNNNLEKEINIEPQAPTVSNGGVIPKSSIPQLEISNETKQQTTPDTNQRTFGNSFVDAGVKSILEMAGSSARVISEGLQPLNKKTEMRQAIQQKIDKGGFEGGVYQAIQMLDIPQSFKNLSNLYYDTADKLDPMGREFEGKTLFGKNSVKGASENIKYILMSLTSQLPQIAEVVSAAYAKDPSLATKIISAQAYGGKLRQIEKEFPEVNELKKQADAVLTGLLEYATEKMGTERIMNGILRKNANGIIKNWLGLIKESLSSFGGEFIEEGISGELEPVIDLLLLPNEDSKKTFTDKVKDIPKVMMENLPSAGEQGFIGGLAGAGQASIASNNARKQYIETKKAIDKEEKKVIELEKIFIETVKDIEPEQAKNIMKVIEEKKQDIQDAKALNEGTIAETETKQPVIQDNTPEPPMMQESSPVAIDNQLTKEVVKEKEITQPIKDLKVDKPKEDVFEKNITTVNDSQTKIEDYIKNKDKKSANDEYKKLLGFISKSDFDEEIKSEIKKQIILPLAKEIKNIKGLAKDADTGNLYIESINKVEVIPAPLTGNATKAEAGESETALTAETKKYDSVESFVESQNGKYYSSDEKLVSRSKKKKELREIYYKTKPEENSDVLNKEKRKKEKEQLIENQKVKSKQYKKIVKSIRNEMTNKQIYNEIKSIEKKQEALSIKMAEMVRTKQGAESNRNAKMGNSFDQLNDRLSTLKDVLKLAEPAPLTDEASKVPDIEESPVTKKPDTKTLDKKKALEDKLSKISAEIDYRDSSDMPGPYVTGGSGINASRKAKLDKQLSKRIGLAKEYNDTKKEIENIDRKIKAIENAPKRKRAEEMIEQKLLRNFESIEVGDKIDVGGNYPLVVIKKNKKTAITEGGTKWNYNEIADVLKADKQAEAISTEKNKDDFEKQAPKVEQKPKATSIKEEFASKGYNLDVKKDGEFKTYIITKEGITGRFRTDKIKSVDDAIASFNKLNKVRDVKANVIETNEMSEGAKRAEKIFENIEMDFDEDGIIYTDEEKQQYQEQLKKEAEKEYYEAKNNLTEFLISEKGSIDITNSKNKPLFDDLVTIAKYHIKKGATTLRDFIVKMKADTGKNFDKVRKYLKELYDMAKKQIANEGGFVDLRNIIADVEAKRNINKANTNIDTLGISSAIKENINETRKKLELKEVKGVDTVNIEDLKAKVEKEKRYLYIESVLENAISKNLRIETIDVLSAGYLINQLSTKIDEDMEKFRYLESKKENTNKIISEIEVNKNNLTRIQDMLHLIISNNAQQMRIIQETADPLAKYQKENIVKATIAKKATLTKEEKDKIDELARDSYKKEKKANDMIKKDNDKKSEKIKEEKEAKDNFDKEKRKFHKSKDKNVNKKDVLIKRRENLYKKIANMGYNVQFDIIGANIEVIKFISELASIEIQLGALSLEEVVSNIKSKIPEVTSADIYYAMSNKVKVKDKRTIGAMTKLKNSLLSEATYLADINNIIEKGERLKGKKISKSQESKNRLKIISLLEGKVNKLRLISDETSLEQKEFKAKQDMLARLEQRLAKMKDLADKAEQGIFEEKKAKLEDPDDVKALKQQISDYTKLVNAKKKIKDITDAIASGDIDKVRSKSRIEPINIETKKAILEANTAKQLLNQHIKHLEEKTFLDKLIDYINIPRVTQTMGDFPPVFNQGALLGAFDIKGNLEAFSKGMSTIFSEKNANDIWIDMQGSKNFHIARYVAKVKFTDLNEFGIIGLKEEMLDSDIVNKIPGIKHIKNMSERNFVTYMNMKMMMAFDSYMSINPDATLNELKAIGTYINYATGKGDLSYFGKSSKLLGILLFAPKFAISKAQVIYHLHKSWDIKSVRDAMLKDAIGFAIPRISFLVSMALLGVEVGLDPREPDFGKIVIGNLHINVFAGYLQIPRAILRSIMAIKFLMPKSLEEETSWSKIWYQFFRYKANSWVNFAETAATGKNLFGVETGMLENAVNSFSPFSPKDIFDTWIKGDIDNPLIKLFTNSFAMMGGRIGIYEKNKPKNKSKKNESNFDYFDY